MVWCDFLPGQLSPTGKHYKTSHGSGQGGGTYPRVIFFRTGGQRQKSKVLNPWK